MIEIILSTITVLFNIYLGLFVFLRNTHSWTNRLFLALTIFINGYVITNYFSLHPPGNTPVSQLMWIRIVMAEASFLGPTLLLLVGTFPRDKIKLGKIKKILLLTLCLSSFVLSLSPWVFQSIEYPNGQPLPIPGPAIPIFMIDFAGLFLTSFALLIYKLKKAKGLERTQIWYFLLGIILTFSLMTLSTLFLVVIFKFSGLVFLGPLYTLILVAFIAYAIIKHRFLDSRLIVARAVAYTLIIAVSGGIYVPVSFLFSSLFLGFRVTINQLLIYGFITLIIAFSFQYLKHYLEKLTDKVFFKGHYESDQLLSDLSRIMSSHIQLKDITNYILQTLISQMRITKGAFILFEGQSIYESLNAILPLYRL